MADEEQEVVSASDNGMLATLNKSEIDQQIATAHKFPRSIRKFLDESRQLVTLNEAVADDCIYALPRDGKTIEGPSARFAEIIAHSWGNSRAGARVIDDKGDFVTAQGVFHDLEKNVAITYEVRRRIVDKNGNRFKLDMIGVTANAACSIALRNAVLKGVPKAFWQPLYEDARKIVMGDAKTLANRRATAMATLQKFGATEIMVLKKLGVAGIEDVTLEHLGVLRGIATAIKDGDTTAELMFSDQESDKPAIQQPTSKSEKKAAEAAKAAPAKMAEKTEASASADQVKAMRAALGEQSTHDEHATCSAFKISCFEDATVSQGNEIIKFLQEAK